MDPTTFDVVLFLHITAAVTGFMVAAVLHVGLLHMRRAHTVAELHAWGPTISRLDLLFPLNAAALVGLGAWLLHLSGGAFGWSDGWVITAAVTLGIVEAVGGGVIGRRNKALLERIEAAPPVEVGPDLRRAVLDPGLWIGAHGTLAAVLGIVYLMVTKPSGGMSVVVVVVAATLGVLSALPLLRAPAAEGAGELDVVPG